MSCDGDLGTPTTQKSSEARNRPENTFGDSPATHPTATNMRRGRIGNPTQGSAPLGIGQIAGIRFSAHAPSVTTIPSSPQNRPSTFSPLSHTL